MPFEVTIVSTVKGFNDPADEYTQYNFENDEFPSLEEAKDFIADRYRVSKTRRKIYRDIEEDPGYEHIGWIYCYKEQSYNDYKWYLHQDWVSVSQLSREPVLF